MSTEYDHPIAGLLTAVPADAFRDANPGTRVPPLADWLIVRKDQPMPQPLGSVMDERAVLGGEPSSTAPGEDDEKPFEAYSQAGRYITCTHSLRGAMAVVGNQAGDQS